MATSTEYLTQVSNLYVALFNRAPDTAGMKFWSEGLANGASLSAVTNGFLTAPEGQAIYTPAQTAEQFVGTFYQTVFGRAPDADGLAFWLAALESAGGMASAEARTFLVSAIVDVVSQPLDTKPEGMSDADYATTVNDRALFGNKVAYATFVGTYEGAEVTPGTKTSLAAITADPASVTAAETAFTQPGGGGGGGGGGTPDPEPVVPTTGDDLLETTAAALAEEGYTIDGLDGNDVLLVKEASGALDGTGKVTNIEALRVAAVDATTVDATLFAGVTSFGSAGSAAPVAFTNLAEGQTGAVSGANADTSFGFDATAAAAAISLTDVEGGAVRVSGTAVTSLALTAAGAGNNLELVSVIGAPAESEEVGATPSAITSVTIDTQSTGSTSINVVEGLQGATVTVTGAGQLAINTLAGVTTFDASANTGGVWVADLVNGAAFKGSSAADILGVSGTLSSDATIDLGAGDDSLSFATGTVMGATGVSITLGEGSDTVNVGALTLAAETEESLAASVVSITDFSAGDTITFVAGEPTAGVAIQFTDLSAAEALYLAGANAVESAGAGSISAFLWGSDTYIIADMAVGETAADGVYGVGDVLVKLSGIVDTTAITVVGGSVTYAVPEVVEAV